MRRDLMQKAADAVLAPLQFPATPGGPRIRTGRQQEAPSTKTTIVAFKYADGVMCAADRKVSGGYHIYDQEMIKMWRVSPNSVMLGCGSVGQIQSIRDILHRQCTSFLRSTGQAMSLEGQAKIVARCCNWYSMIFDDFSFGTLLAGLNRDGEFKIISVEEDGSRLPYERFDAMGSGGANAKIALDKGWRSGMDDEAARILAVDAIFHAANRDSGSSPLQVAMPVLATVTAEGVKRIPEEQVMQVAAQILVGKLGVQVDLARAIQQQRRRQR